MKEAEEKAEEERRQKLEVDAEDNIKAVEDMQRIEEIIKKRVNADDLTSSFCLSRCFPFPGRRTEKRTKRIHFEESQRVCGKEETKRD